MDQLVSKMLLVSVSQGKKVLVFTPAISWSHVEATHVTSTWNSMDKTNMTPPKCNPIMEPEGRDRKYLVTTTVSFFSFQLFSLTAKKKPTSQRRIHKSHPKVQSLYIMCDSYYLRLRYGSLGLRSWCYLLLIERKRSVRRGSKDTREIQKLYLENSYLFLRYIICILNCCWQLIYLMYSPCMIYIIILLAFNISFISDCQPTLSS